MRVLHTIQGLGVGGAERVLVRLAHGAAERGDTVAVVARDGELAAELPPGTARFELPLIERRPRNVLAAVRAVDRALRAFRPDVVHAHNPAVGLATGLAALRGRRARGLVSVHGVPDEDYAHAARALGFAGLPVVACGPGIATGLAEAGRPARETVPNGVGPAPAPADRASLGIAGPLLVTVGRLTPAKNQALAVRGLAEVPGATLLVVGDGPERPAVEAAAHAAGVAGRVVFTGARADARALTGAADVVVIPSRSEGLPLAALEALAAGRPIVATAVRGLRDLLEDGRTALLVPPGDEAALAAAVRRLLADGDLARALGEAGLQEASRYTEDAMVAAYLRLYGEVAR
jgi:glycosyltransferase involved in cell wall biosynthesis